MPTHLSFPLASDEQLCRLGGKASLEKGAARGPLMSVFIESGPRSHRRAQGLRRGESYAALYARFVIKTAKSGAASAAPYRCPCNGSQPLSKATLSRAFISIPSAITSGSKGVALFLSRLPCRWGWLPSLRVSQYWSGQSDGSPDPIQETLATRSAYPSDPATSIADL